MSNLQLAKTVLQVYIWNYSDIGFSYIYFIFGVMVWVWNWSLTFIEMLSWFSYFSFSCLSLRIIVIRQRPNKSFLFSRPKKRFVKLLRFFPRLILKRQFFRPTHPKMKLKTVDLNFWDEFLVIPFFLYFPVSDSREVDVGREVSSGNTFVMPLGDLTRFFLWLKKNKIK